MDDSYNEKFIASLRRNFSYLEEEGFKIDCETKREPSVGIIYKSEKYTIYILKDSKDGSLLGDAIYISIEKKGNFFESLKPKRLRKYIDYKEIKQYSNNIAFPKWFTEENFDYVLSRYSQLIKEVYLPIFKSKKW